MPGCCVFGRQMVCLVSSVYQGRVVLHVFYKWGTHVLQPRRTNEVTTFLFVCFLFFVLHYITERFRNTCDIFFYTGFRTTIFISCEKMSGKGDGSSASSVDLSRRDFRAMMYYDHYQGKCFQECFQSLKHCFWRSVSAQSHCCQMVQTVYVWSENVRR